MNPWIHIHTTPTGIAAPCCIAESCATDDGVGNSRKQSLMELVNSDKMKQLRLDMLTGVKSEECKKCYEHEAQDVDSFRVMTNRQYKHAIDDVIENTNLEDGSLKQFKMRYFDIRFSNICIDTHGTQVGKAFLRWTFSSFFYFSSQLCWSWVTL
jgi:hypothetical protein